MDKMRRKTKLDNFDTSSKGECKRYLFKNSFCIHDIRQYRVSFLKADLIKLSGYKFIPRIKLVKYPIDFSWAKLNISLIMLD